MRAKKTKVSEDPSGNKTSYKCNEHIHILFSEEMYLRRNTLPFPPNVSFTTGVAISKLLGSFVLKYVALPSLKVLLRRLREKSGQPISTKLPRGVRNTT